MQKYRAKQYVSKKSTKNPSLSKPCIPVQLTQESFDKIIDSFFLSTYQEDKLFHHSLKKSNFNLSNYFNVLYNSNSLKKRLIFIQSPCFNGVDYLVEDIKKKYDFIEFVPFLSKEDLLSDLLSIIKERTNNTLQGLLNQFLIIKNFPFELLNMIIYNTQGNKLYHAWIGQFQSLLSLIKQFLNSLYPKLIILFWWDDSSIDNYILEKMLKKDIIANPNTEIITLKQIPNTKLKYIAKQTMIQYQIQLTSNIEEEIDKIINDTKGNLLQFKLQLFSFIKNFKKHPVVNFSTNKNQAHSQQNTVELDKDIFHLLGKLLYNKRIDPKTGKIRQMKKAEFLQSPYPQLYFKIQDVIDSSPISKEEFNNLLIEASFNHFRDIGEIALACESFSYSDTISKFGYKLIEKNFPFQDTIENMKFILNGTAVVAFNISQYDYGKAAFSSFKKSIYHYKILFNKNLYIDCIENNPSVSTISRKTFIKEIEPYYAALKKEQKRRSQLHINYELNDFDLDKIKYEKKEQNSLIEDENINKNWIKNNKINRFLDKENQYYLEDRMLIKKIENKKEARQEELQNIINIFENDEEDSDPYDIVDDD